MKMIHFRAAFFSLVVCLAACQGAWSMTIDLGSNGTELIGVGDEWRFFPGTIPPSDPDDAWRQVDFNDSLWEIGRSGFGYGDGDDATVLSDMEDNYITLYIRKEFTVSALPADDIVELEVDYDDGLIAYLNGTEVKRLEMPDGPVDYQTRASGHEAGAPETYTLGTVGDLLNQGKNVLAIEGHNTSRGSSDFSLIPALRTRSAGAGIVKNGQTLIVEQQTLDLTGSTDAAAAVAVTIGGSAADFNAADGTWSGQASLEPGLNTVLVEALDATSAVVDSGSVEVVYVPAANHAEGTLAGDATWSGAVLVEQTVTVPAGATLTIEPGTVVLLKTGCSIVVNGRLLANGTEAEPIRFTHYGDGTTWERLMFVTAQDSRLSYCIIEYSDCEGDHKDYYDNDCDPQTPLPSRDYFQAVVAIACHLDIEGCLFQNLPDDSSSPEGDAIAIISDDPDVPGDATANIRNCQFVSIGQGVHTRFSYVLVEGCFFTRHHGDNDDIDLYGESDPPPLIRNNVMISPAHDDMINPTLCSAVIVGNLIANCDDHGVVLRDKGYPVMINNIIYNCSSAGIAVQNQCDALLINNTVVDCGRGIRFFDHTGRWGPPYCLNPGSGRATLINCIFWDCSHPILLTDSPWEGDRGSHVVVEYCDIFGGRDAVSVSANSTLTWGQGNINLDPLFADAANGDFHLKSLYGRWDPSQNRWVVDTSMSPCIDAGTDYFVDDPNYGYAGLVDSGPELWPHGGLVNMGAYGATPQASMSALDVGNKADVNKDGRVDFEDLAEIGGLWRIREVLLRQDLNRDGSVDHLDAAELAGNWLWRQ